LAIAPIKLVKHAFLSLNLRILRKLTSKPSLRSAFTAPELRGRSRGFTAQQRELKAFTLLPKLRALTAFTLPESRGCFAFTLGKVRECISGFTLLELLVVMAIIAVVALFVTPAVNGIKESTRLTRAVNDVAGILELARAEAMATRSYTYIGFATATNSDGNPELRIGAVISIDGSSNTAAANLRPISKLVKLPNVKITNYTSLPAAVKSAADISLQADSDYVIMFPSTTYLKDKFNDPAFDSCPTMSISPQGDVLHSSNPSVFFRTTSSVGLVPTRGVTVGTTDGAIVSYYGGTGQLRVTRPKS
jgi:prepilin-type N-terminal cleavage/methylation domain-containing protein